MNDNLLTKRFNALSNKYKPLYTLLGTSSLREMRKSYEGYPIRTMYFYDRGVMVKSYIADMSNEEVAEWKARQL